MSHAGMIIGIPGLQIERVKRSHGIEIWANRYQAISLVLLVFVISIQKRVNQKINNSPMHLYFTPGFE